MKYDYKENRVTELKIAYIGGGSRGWARTLMSDLAMCEDMSGDVYLYDIDYDSALCNEAIGNRFNDAEGAKSRWNYHAAKTPKEACTGADFVIISILPGTFDEMESDVHAPEKYGIYQSVGDTSGPGGILRAMRSAPMFEEIALYIKEYCPDAWVINYTNPMTLCIKTLYRTFPEIKAYGCCHEVFGTQWLMQHILHEKTGIRPESSKDVKVNIVGVNHFTWFTAASYKDIDLMPMYRDYAREHAEDGCMAGNGDNWMNNSFSSIQKVKFDLCNRFSYVAAAGDRHLAEFCEGKWYLKDADSPRDDWGFGLTPVSWRKQSQKDAIAHSERLRRGEGEIKIKGSGEEGVIQMRALLGLREDFTTNVNMPNRGQIPNLPEGAIVETNFCFRAGSATPLYAGAVPNEILPLIGRICTEQEALDKAIAERDLNAIFNVFANDPLVTCSLSDAKALFKEMVENTKKYLGDYDLTQLESL